MMQVVDVDEKILRALDVDARGIFPSGIPDIITGARSYRDEWGVERVMPEGSLYYDIVAFPLAGDITVSEIARYPWPDPDAAIRRMGLKERAKQIHSAGYAAVLNLPSAFVHTSQYLRGFEDWFVDIAADPKLAAALYDAVLDVSMATCRTMLDEVGQEVDVVMASDDLGLQDSLMISPTVYRTLIKPRHRRYIQLMHDMSPAKVFFHTCGSVADIIDDLIEIGVDVLNPVQVTAAGMDPKGLKARYGDRLASGAPSTRRACCPTAARRTLKPR